MKFTKILIFAGLLLITFSGNAQTEMKHQAYIALMDSADRACETEDWRKAEQFLISALRLEPANPSNVLLMSNLGMIRFYAGNDSIALKTLNDAAEMAPNSVVVLQNRAKVLSAMGRDEEAYIDRGKIIEIDSGNIHALYLHALGSIVRGDKDMTVRDLGLMEKQYPSDERTLRIKSLLMINEGRYIEALSPLSRLIEVEPASELFSMRALCNLMLERLDDASEDIAEGLRMDPADGELYLYRSLLNKMRYRNDDSLKDAQRAVELGIDRERAAPLLK